MHFLAPQKTKPEKHLALYSLVNIAFEYPDGKRALNGISLDIFQGDRIALLGQNGSGKTTLAKHLNGLHRQTAGEIYYKGDLFNSEVIQTIRLETGLLFQDPDDHLFCSSLYDDIAFGPMNQGLPQQLVDQRVRKAATEAKLEEYLFKPAHHLSFGQKKRAAFAAVMAMEPAVLILDEPSANLDSKQEQIFKKQLEQYKGTLICINHDLLFLYGLCDRAVVLSEGRIHHDYDFNDLLSHKKSLKDHGLDFSFRFKCCSDHNHDHPHIHSLQTHSHNDSVSARKSENRQQPIIQFNDYSYMYPDGTLGLDALNLEIDTGDKLGVIGENGAGKSTLSCALLGLIQGYGSYAFHGQKISSKRRKNLWQEVGMVFQDTADQLFCPSCWEEIAFGPQQLGCSEDEVNDRVQKALEIVKLSGYEERVPQNMSGGERKRLAIAAALSMNPKVLILDEPTAGLDPQGEELLLEIIKDLPVTLILVTHDLFFLSELTDRTVVMHQGRVIRDYATTEFLNDSQLETLNQLDFTYKNICHHEVMAMQERV